MFSKSILTIVTISYLGCNQASGLDDLKFGLVDSEAIRIDSDTSEESDKNGSSKNGSSDSEVQGEKNVVDSDVSKDPDKGDDDGDDDDSVAASDDDDDDETETNTDPKEKNTDCKEGELKCEGECVPDDINNCGDCGHDCTELPHVAGTVKCNSGTCILTKSSCENGWAHCVEDPDKGCETNITKASNCGKCGNNCTGTSKELCTQEGEGYECASGCKSNAPTLCGDTCVNTDNNTLHCGKCNNECESVEGGRPVCEDGKCGFECTDSTDLECDDGCFPDDDENCGECGNNCEEDDEVCDGKGSCVECIDNGDCNRGDANVCIKNKCKQCESGGCCDEDNSYRPDSYACKTMDAEYRCDGDSNCGAKAQELVKKIYCSGKSPECNGSPEGSWNTIEDCDSGELCKYTSSSVSCVSDRECSCSGSKTTYDSDNNICWQDPKAPGTYDWSGAKEYCDGLSLGGQNDWRLASKENYVDILDGCSYSIMGYCSTCDDSTTCDSLFGADVDSYWTSTSENRDSSYRVELGTGLVYPTMLDGALSVRCVR